MSKDAAPKEHETRADTVGSSPHEDEVGRLAALEPLAYDQQRAASADAMGVRVATLDDAVRNRRSTPATVTDRSVFFPEVEPWPSTVDAGALLDALFAAVRRHLAISAAAAVIVALWIAHTWVADRFQHTPRLGITSPAGRCGKSTLLDVLRLTCRRPLKADNISASGVFRTVETLSPVTLLLDEADSFLGDKEELRGVLNSGYERSGEVIRVVEMKGEHQAVRFRTFAPVAIAGIGALPATLEDRAMPIVLQRKGASEETVKLRAPGAKAALADLARKLARWAADRGAHLCPDPAIPEAMGDREGDIAVPLLAIADDAGAAWAARGRAALLEVLGKREAEGGNQDAGALMLSDLRDLFEKRGATRLQSAEVVVALGEMEERPWPEWRGSKPITATQLARMLSPFGVRPQNLRMEKVGVVKGYTADSFRQAWARYLFAPEVRPAPKLPTEPLHRYITDKLNIVDDSTRYGPTRGSGLDKEESLISTTL